MERSCQKLRVGRASDPTEIEGIICFFEHTARAEGWEPQGELRIHACRSVYFGLWEVDAQGAQEEPVGGLQMVDLNTGGPIALPCQRVWPEVDFAGRTGCAHVAMLAIAPEWRGKSHGNGGSPFWDLTADLWRHCVLNGIEELWLEATPRTLRCYQRLGWPLVIRGDLRMHWGEPCYLCSLDLRLVAGELARRSLRSHTYQTILQRAIVPISAGNAL